MSALSPWVDSWARLATAIAWQSAALAGLALACERLFRLRHPGARYALWWFVLLGPLVLAPARLWFAELAPRWRVVITAPPAAADLLPHDATPRSPGRAGAPSAPRPATSAPAAGLPVAAPVFWMLGCFPLVARLVVGQRRARRLVAQGDPVTRTEVVAAVSELCRRAGTGREVPLRASTEVGSAMLCGVTRPTILLPRQWLAELDRTDLRALLAHEVAHARRGDVFANLVQRWLEALLFFHPAVWLASGRAALAREELCDGWALAHGVARSGYARALAIAAERVPARPCVAMVGLAERRHSLLVRVEAIVRGRDRSRTSRPVLTVLAAAALVAAIALAAARLVVPRGRTGGIAPLARAGGWGSTGTAVLPRRGITLANLDQRALRHYAVEQRAGDYPAGESTARPEQTYAAIQQAAARGDMSVFARLNVSRLAQQPSGTPPRVSVSPAVAAALRDTKILEVWLYHDRAAAVIASVRRPDTGVPYFDVRAFELEQRGWLNSGESYEETVEAARSRAAVVLDYHWRLTQGAVR